MKINDCDKFSIFVNYDVVDDDDHDDTNNNNNIHDNNCLITKS